MQIEEEIKDLAQRFKDNGIPYELTDKEAAAVIICFRKELKVPEGERLSTVLSKTPNKEVKIIRTNTQVGDH